MQKNNFGETLVSVLITVAIIVVLLVSLYKILDYNQNIDDVYRGTNYVNILENNTYTIVQKSNTNNILEKEIFYIYKNGTQFEILTGSLNEKYRYVNNMGKYVENIQNEKKIYSRFCFMERNTTEGQSIKCSIKELVKK